MLNISYLWESRDASAPLVYFLFAERLIHLPVWIPWYPGPSVSAHNHLWVDPWHAFGLFFIVRLSAVALVATIAVMDAIHSDQSKNIILLCILC